MFIDWTCVLDDGSRPFAAELPPDQRRPLAIATGEDTTIRIELVTPAGAPVVLAGGEFLVLNIKSNGSSSKRLAVKQSTTDTARGANRYAISLLAADTRTIAPQAAVFDLWAIRGTGRVLVVPLSEARLSRTSLAAT